MSTNSTYKNDVHDNDIPGSGWTNGAIKAATLYPYSRDGTIVRYETQRRWINLHKGWTRIGITGNPHDFRHSSSGVLGESFHGGGDDIDDDSLQQEANAVKSLISQLCESFHTLGWATGTGGGVSIRVGGPSERRPWRVFVAPSGIQKEDMIGDDVFELDMDGKVVQSPKTPNLKQSACTPLWYVVYRKRPSAKCVIHTHSIHAQMATLLDYPAEQSSVLRMTHLEMLKGVGHHAYDDVLEIPIIDNRPSEDLLASQLESVMDTYPKCNAVLVRRHGVYVWGDSWEQAKTQCESFDYLFESAIKMKQLGMDISAKPLHGTYRVDDDTSTMNGGGGEPAKKRAKIASAAEEEENGFRGSGQASNQGDLQTNMIPLLPRDGKILLLDIEGCTTSISFVKDTLFPYVTEHLQTFVDTMSDEEVSQAAKSLDQDVIKHGISVDHPRGCTVQEMVVLMVQRLMENDVKATGLKALQGKMWKAGYDKGDLKGHVYDDFVPMLQWCQSHKVSVNIYSSGSIQAQKLLFGHSLAGDLTTFLSHYFDTTSGSKKEAQSYGAIAKSLGVHPSQICFVSDAEAELVAARQAGIGHVVMSIRPGNVPLTNVGKSFPAVHSLLQLCGT